MQGACLGMQGFGSAAQNEPVFGMEDSEVSAQKAGGAAENVMKNSVNPVTGLWAFPCNDGSVCISASAAGIFVPAV